MRAAAIGFALGVCWLQRAAVLPSYMSMGLLAAAALLLGVGARHADRARFFGIAAWLPVLSIGLAAACIGYDWAACRAHVRLGTALPLALEGRDVQLTGTVLAMPMRTEDGVRVVLQVDAVHTPLPDGMPAARFASRVRLSWAGGSGVLAGQRWRLTVRLKRPHANANFDATNAEVWMLQQGIRATGYVRPRPAARRVLAGTAEADVLPDHSWSMAARFYAERLRSSVAQRMATVLGDAPHAGVLRALAIGEQSGISARDWERFTRTGTNHLVAISGLHVGLVAGFAAALVGGAWRHAARLGWPLPLWLPAPHVAAGAALLCAAAFVALAGFGIPAQRAFWMLTAVCVAARSGRFAAPSALWCVALLLVLIADPWAVTSAGFWLSFGAVAAILFATNARGRAVQTPDDALAPVAAAAPAVAPRAATRIGRPKLARPPASGLWRRLRRAGPPLRRALAATARVQLAVTLALVPTTVGLFGQVSLSSPVANAIAIPWVSFGVVPPVLAGVVLPAPFDAASFKLAHHAMAVLVGVLDGLAAPDWTLLHLPRPTPLAIAAALIGVALWLGPRGLPLQPLAPLLCLPLLLHRPAALAHGEFRVTFFDIGQGNAALVETRGHRLLFDTGPPVGRTDAGARIIVPALRAQGISALDTLIVSHDHDDHYGGAASILRALRVRRFVASLPPRQALWSIAREQGAHGVRCRQGQAWQSDGVAFALLWPENPDAGAPPNAMSCVLRVSNGIHTVLLTGDIEAPQEGALLRRGVPLAATVLLAPHHGSRTSSTSAFVDAAAPAHVVFQMGYRNRHRHPNETVVRRYQSVPRQLYRSDLDGAVRFESSARTLRVTAYRRIYRRYWMGI